MGIDLGGPPPGPIIVTNTLEIDNNALTLSLKSMRSQTVVLNQIIIKDYSGHVVTTADIVPTELPYSKTTNITINLSNGELNSGIEYKAIFYTTDGNN